LKYGVELGHDLGENGGEGWVQIWGT